MTFLASLLGLIAGTASAAFWEAECSPLQPGCGAGPANIFAFTLPNLAILMLQIATGLAREGLRVERQKLVPMQFEGVTYPESFRLDLLVEGTLIIAVKSTERNLPVYSKQLLTYLRLTEQPVGLLMNFGYPTFREGLKRIVNGPADLKPKLQ